MAETGLQTKAEDSLKNLLNIKRSVLEKTMPASMGISADTYIQAALNKVADSAELQKCTPMSVCLAVMQAATIGLRVDLKQAHLVPRGGKACLDIDWRGYVHLAYQSGIVEDCNAYAVRENDPFEYEFGTNPRLIHKPDLKSANRGQIVLAYAYARLTTGRTLIEVVDQDTINEIIKLSRSGAWAKWPEMMWRKTALKRLLQRVPQGASNIASAINARLAQAAQDFIDETKTPHTEKTPIIDITATEADDDGDYDKFDDALANDESLKHFPLEGMGKEQLLKIYEDMISATPASKIEKVLTTRYKVKTPSELNETQLKIEIEELRNNPKG